jgi:hypothetical protein
VRTGTTARVIHELGRSRPVPALRLLPPPPPRPRRPGVIRHPDEIMADNKKVLADLVEILRADGIKYALVGGLVAGLYGKERATVDVDLLVPRRAMDHLAGEIARRRYTVERSEDMLRASKRGVAVADLVVREAHPVLRAASAITRSAVLLGVPVQVVRRGAFVALKFHAAVSPTRQAGDRFQDVTDIVRVVDRGLSARDERLARTIAAQIYPGAEDELAALIDDVRHGRPVRI